MSSMIKKLFIERPFEVDNDVEITFEDICLIDDYWVYVNNVFLSGIYADVGRCDKDATTNMEHRKFTVLKENLLMGPPRLKQLKVRNDSCIIDEIFKRNFRECFGSYQHSLEDTLPFGPNNGTPWTYHTSEELQDMFLSGNLHIYAGGGYYLDISDDSCKSESQIKELQDGGWITRGTRLVLLEFSLFNTNENLFCIVKLIAEIPATGGIKTSFSIRTLKLLTFVNSENYFLMICEIIFLIMVCWYTMVEILELYNESWSYFKSVWNIVDMLIILISYGSFTFSVYRLKYIGNKFDEYMKFPDKYISLDVLAFCEEQYNNFIAICVFLVWIKIFKYVSFNKTMQQFCTTLKRCATDLLGFGFMFFVAFIAYAQLGYILFGTENENFRTFRDSLFTLLRTILGDFDYLAIEQANRILGPIFFITYIFIMFFVLLASNMFLAIINDTYSEVKSENVSSDIQIGSYIKAKCNQCAEHLATCLPFLKKTRNKMREKRRKNDIVDGGDGETNDL
ncbi:hypothetical protein HA402_010515 [Bradysia odoriphaga]|nr:hypothetical protein HA402_010515 [Bradysia odoriphaga]